MGKRGPKPKNKSKLELHGSWRANLDRPSGLSLEPLTKLPQKPKRLQGEAAKFWRRVGIMLIQAETLTQLDIVAFELACEAYGQYCQADDLVQKSKPVVETSNGNIVKHPAVIIRNKALQQLKSMMSEFGWTPSTRDKIPQPKHEKPNDFLRLMSRKDRKD